MRKLFVSQPMKGLTNEEITEARGRAVLNAKIVMALMTEEQNNVEVIDSFFKDAPVDAKPLWYLGESLKKLAEADVAIFAKGWQNNRGCRIEHEAAVAYGIEVLYE